MSWLEKNRKINIGMGGGGDDYSRLESKLFVYKYVELFCLLLLKTEMNYSWTKYKQIDDSSEFLLNQICIRHPPTKRKQFKNKYKSALAVD